LQLQEVNSQYSQQKSQALKGKPNKNNFDCTFKWQCLQKPLQLCNCLMVVRNNKW